MRCPVPALCLLAASLLACWRLSNDTGYWFTVLGHTVQFTNLTLFSIAMLPGVVAPVLCHALPLNNPIARYIGKVSYSVYLLHFTIISLVILVLRSWPDLLTPGDWHFGLYLMATLICCVAVSTVTYFLVEEPGKRLFVWLLTAPKRRPVSVIGEVPAAG